MTLYNASASDNVKLLNQGAREWRTYYYEPFILGGRDVASTLNWDATANPQIKLSAEHMAGQKMGVRLRAAAADAMQYNIEVNDTYAGAGASGAITSQYHEGVNVASITNNDDWLTFGAPGVHFNFVNPVGGDDGDEFHWDIPGLGDSRWRKRYFGGYICYMDIPHTAVELMNNVLYTDKLPFSPGDFTILFNVFGDRMSTLSTITGTVNYGTTIWLTSSVEDASSSSKSHTRDHFVDDYDWTQRGGGVQINTYDASRDGRLYSPDDTHGFTNMPEYRFKLVFENLSGTEGTFAYNQFVAIMVIPH